MLKSLALIVRYGFGSNPNYKGSTPDYSHKISRIIDSERNIVDDDDNNRRETVNSPFF